MQRFCTLMCHAPAALLPLTLGMALAAPARAMNPDLYELPLTELVNIRVSTASRHNETLAQAPATLYVVTDADIRRYGYTSLADVLAQAPGVQIVNPDFFAVGGQRGFLGSFSQSLLLINGREMQNLIAAEAFIGDQFATHNIARIEILNGPGSVLYGANALTGVINIITKQDAPDYEATEVAAELGSQDTRAASVTFGKKFGTLRLSGSGRVSQRNGWDHEDAIQGTRLSEGAAPIVQATSASHADTYENTHRAQPYSLKAEWNGFYLGREAYEVRSGKGLENIALRFDRQYDERHFRLNYAGWEQSINEHLHFKLENQHYREEFWGRNHNFDADTFDALVAAGRDPSTPLTLAEIEEAFTLIYSQRGSGGSSLNRSFAEAQLTLSDTLLTTGIEYTEKDIYGVALAFEDQFPAFDSTVSEANPLRRPTYQSTLRSAYVQLKTPLADRLALTIGSRWDDQTHYGSIQTVRSGMVWAPGDTSTLKLLYGEAFREPTIFELGPSEDTARELDPARIKTWELGYLQTLGDHLHWQSTLFHSRALDLIVPGSTVDFINSDDEVRNRGWENQWQWQRERWRGDAAYVYTDPEDQRVNGNAVDALNVYQHRVMLGLAWQADPHWWLGARLGYYSALDAEHGNSSVNEVISLDHAMPLDLTASFNYPLARQALEGYITLHNALDTDWQHPNVRNTGPRDYPQPGRTLLTRITVRF